MIRAHDTHGFAIATSQQFCKFIFQFHINYKEENLVSCRSTDNLFSWNGGGTPASKGCTHPYLFIIQHSHARLDSRRRQEKPRWRFCLLHKLVPPPLAGLTGVVWSGEPILCLAFLIKVVFPNYVRVWVAIFVFVSTSIEMAPSTITDLRSFIRWQDLLPASMMMLED
jgi:hypothetical protein